MTQLINKIFHQTNSCKPGIIIGDESFTFQSMDSPESSKVHIPGTRGEHIVEVALFQEILKTDDSGHGNDDDTGCSCINRHSI